MHGARYEGRKSSENIFRSPPAHVGFSYPVALGWLPSPRGTIFSEIWRHAKGIRPTSELSSGSSSKAAGRTGGIPPWPAGHPRQLRGAAAPPALRSPAPPARCSRATPPARRGSGREARQAAPSSNDRAAPRLLRPALAIPVALLDPTRQRRQRNKQWPMIGRNENKLLIDWRLSADWIGPEYPAKNAATPRQYLHGYEVSIFACTYFASLSSVLLPGNSPGNLTKPSKSVGKRLDLR